MALKSSKDDLKRQKDLGAPKSQNCKVEKKITFWKKINKNIFVPLFDFQKSTKFTNPLEMINSEKTLFFPLSTGNGPLLLRWAGMGQVQADAENSQN